MINANQPYPSSHSATPPPTPPVVFEVVVQQGRNPDGMHPGDFAGVEPNPKQRPDYAPSLIARFRIPAGHPLAGTMLSDFYPQKVTPDNKTGRLLTGLLGRPLQPNEKIGFSQFLGQRFIVTVQNTKIVSVTRAPQ